MNFGLIEADVEDPIEYVYILYGMHDRVIKVTTDSVAAKALPFGAIRYEEHKLEIN